jgi:hypothetical protein
MRITVLPHRLVSDASMYCTYWRNNFPQDSYVVDYFLKLQCKWESSRQLCPIDSFQKLQCTVLVGGTIFLKTAMSSTPFRIFNVHVLLGGTSFLKTAMS